MPNDERDNNVAQATCHKHGEKTHSGQNGIYSLKILIKQLVRVMHPVKKW